MGCRLAALALSSALIGSSGCVSDHADGVQARTERQARIHARTDEDSREREALRRAHARAALSSWTSTQSQAARQAQTFEEIDVNGDGRLDRIEAGASAAFAGRFAGLDINDDGMVTRGEYEAQLAPTATP